MDRDEQRINTLEKVINQAKTEAREETETAVRCARANLENLANQVPGLAEHPMFKVVDVQLGLALGEEPEAPTQSGATT